MKLKSVCLLFGFLSLSTLIRAQNTADIFNAAKPLSWLGLDFSEARFIGDHERLATDAIIREQVTGWNALMLKEQAKYNIEKAFYKSKVDYRLETAIKHNEKLDYSAAASNLLSDSKSLNPEKIQQIASSYNYEGATGTGLLFVVETFNKISEQAVIWVTFVDMSNGKVLLTEKIQGKPKGFGLRNYWAGAVYQILGKIEKEEFDAWRKKYGANKK